MNKQASKENVQIEEKDLGLYVEGIGEFYSVDSPIQIRAKNIRVRYDARPTRIIAEEDEGKENEEFPHFTTIITADGFIVNNRGLGVIGHEDMYSKNISITIYAENQESIEKQWTLMRKKEKEDQGQKKRKSTFDFWSDRKFCTFGIMGFLADHRSNGYYLSLYTSNSMMEEFLRLIFADKVEGLDLSLDMYGLYADCPDYDTYSSRRFFLIPDMGDSIYGMFSTKPSMGYISSLSIFGRSYEFQETGEKAEEDVKEKR